VGFNLNETVYTPVMKSLFGMPDIYGNSIPMSEKPKPQPLWSWPQAHAFARKLLNEQARIRGFKIVYEDYLIYDSGKRTYQYSVRSDRDLYDEGANTILIFDDTGKLLSLYVPTHDNFGSTLNSWIFGLHMGKIGGLPFRIFICAMGITVAMLSITGVYIWFKKWRARSISKSRRAHAASVAKI